MTSYVMTFDVGTTSLKAALVDRDGKIVREGAAEYPVKQLQTGWAEQDPEQIWQAICQTSRRVMAESAAAAQDVVAAVFVAPWKNIIPVTPDGTVLRDSIIWMDARAGEQAQQLNESLGEFVGTGQEFWPRLMWVKQHEPEIWQQAERIMGLNTYFKWRATGEWLTEPSDDLIHSANPRLQEYYSRIANAAGLAEDLDKFAPSKPATELVGNLTAEAAELLGMTTGTKVFGGFGDLVAITLGVGRSRLNDAHIYFGTSSWLVSIIRDRFDLDAPQYFTLDDAHEGALFALQTGCMAFDWIVDQVYRGEKERMGNELLPFINHEVDQIQAGSDGLVATHWLTGELPPFSKNAKGIFLNLTSNHDRRHMVRAMMESICYTHRRNLEMFQQRTGAELENIRVVGGGAVSDVWMQMLADVLQLKVQVPEAPRYTGTMGAYYCAAVGMGWLDNTDAIADAVRLRAEFVPNPDNKDVYDHMFSVYMMLHPALREVFDELNGRF
ncbi:MAG: xylulokinase [Brooklawnia sp.]|jgi:xylulokinase